MFSTIDSFCRKSLLKSFLIIYKDINATGATNELRWMHNSDGKPIVRDFYDSLRPKRNVTTWGTKFGEVLSNLGDLSLSGKQFMGACLQYVSKASRSLLIVVSIMLLKRTLIISCALWFCDHYMGPARVQF